MKSHLFEWPEPLCLDLTIMVINQLFRHVL